MMFLIIANFLKMLENSFSTTNTIIVMKISVIGRLVFFSKGTQIEKSIIKTINQLIALNTEIGNVAFKDVLEGRKIKLDKVLPHDLLVLFKNYIEYNQTGRNAQPGSQSGEKTRTQTPPSTLPQPPQSRFTKAEDINQLSLMESRVQQDANRIQEFKKSGNFSDELTYSGAEDELKNKPKGAWLIHFDQGVDDYVVCYKTNDDPIKHYSVETNNLTQIKEKLDQIRFNDLASKTEDVSALKGNQVNSPNFKNLPTNYRGFVINIDGSDIKIGGMAHPVRYNMNKNLNDLTEDLTKMGFKTMISLDEGSLNEIDQAWSKKNGEGNHHDVIIKDFQAPTKEQYDELYNLVKNAKQGGVMVHCGEGFGRTGTMLASLALRQIFREKVQKNTNDGNKYKFERTELLHLGHYGGNKDVLVTPLVKEAIDFIRNSKECLENVQKENSVENEKQIISLMLLELDLKENAGYALSESEKMNKNDLLKTDFSNTPDTGYGYGGYGYGIH